MINRVVSYTIELGEIMYNYQIFWELDETLFSGWGDVNLGNTVALSYQVIEM